MDTLTVNLLRGPPSGTAAPRQPATNPPQTNCAYDVDPCGYHDAGGSTSRHVDLAKQHFRVAITPLEYLPLDTLALHPSQELPTAQPIEFFPNNGHAASFDDAIWPPDIYASCHMDTQGELGVLKPGSVSLLVERQGHRSVGGQGEGVTDGQDHEPTQTSFESRSDFLVTQLSARPTPLNVAAAKSRTPARARRSANTARMNSTGRERPGPLQLRRQTILGANAGFHSFSCLCLHDSCANATSQPEAGGYATSGGIHESSIDGSSQASAFASNYTSTRTEAKGTEPSRAPRGISRREPTRLDAALLNEVWNMFCRIPKELAWPERTMLLPPTAPHRQMGVC
ncbi:hypothetical protein BT67DRAFT_36296 [Trichocladium antarcticum]|uniref:Uncharacterized protein n=1 Tax=Trichocladium antarcticum TaxID=1450529 RepID=A0AAN6UJ49_9PEZI|nr:hypothetical protein BT67DRAFT_36296 [Trichocladium antarcticum]